MTCFSITWIVVFVFVCIYYIAKNYIFKDYIHNLKKRHSIVYFISDKIIISLSITIPTFISKTDICSNISTFTNNFHDTILIELNYMSNLDFWFFFIPTALGAAMAYYIIGLLLDATALFLGGMGEIICMIAYLILSVLFMCMSYITSSKIDLLPNIVGFLLGYGIDIYLFCIAFKNSFINNKRS